MLWVSLEEAESIPDIHWDIRVLQPPPEQENVQYGELGQGHRDIFSRFPSIFSDPVCFLAENTVFPKISSKRFSVIMDYGHGEEHPGI